MKRILAVAALVLALSVSASAQREYGYGHGRSHSRGRDYLPDMSQVVNNAHIGYGAILTKYWGSHTGLLAGWSQMVPLSSYDPFFLDYGLDLRYSFHSRDNETDVNRKLMALDLPVSLDYAIPVGSALTLLPYAGLDVTFNLWGRYNPSDAKSYSYFGDKMDADANYYRFILGAHAGLKAIIGTVTVGLCYQQDLTRLAKAEEVVGKTYKKTRYVYAPIVTVGYNF